MGKGADAAAVSRKPSALSLGRRWARDMPAMFAGRGRRLTVTPITPEQINNRCRPVLGLLRTKGDASRYFVVKGSCQKLVGAGGPLKPGVGLSGDIHTSQT